jgi:hypothetical protein
MRLVQLKLVQGHSWVRYYNSNKKSSQAVRQESQWCMTWCIVCVKQMFGCFLQLLHIIIQCESMGFYLR